MRGWLAATVVLSGCSPCRPAPAHVDCSAYELPPPVESPRHDDPWMGEQRALVLLLAWEDAPPNQSVEEVQQAFFGETRSLAAYVREASGGRFGLSGTVLDWRTVAARWEDQHPKDPSGAGRLALCAFDGAIDVAAHDAQGNGRIDHLFIVHSGTLPVDRIGPRALFVPGPADRSVLLPSRGVGSVGEHVPIGWYLHEAAHRYFGLKDRYGDHHHGRYGIGAWGLMGLGQWGPHAQVPRADLYRDPVHPRARAKMAMGWVDAQRIDADAHDVLLRPIETSQEVLRVTGGASGFDLVLEVRSPTGFHAGLPGHGLLVWREPYALQDDVVLIQADGRDDLAHGHDLGFRPVPPLDENFADASDPFPGALGVTEMVDPVTGVALRNIQHEGDAVRFDIDVP